MNQLKINDIISNFTVTKKSEIEEISATAVEFLYKKNGCRLLWLDRPDTNKTFAITFKTIPEDNTGVFHILEHSVLCGSKKFPLKEPFLDLLKSSLQTFLNAMTFLDKTMYPVSSRNDKDLLNLVDVYMDAVFNPLIYSKKEIFMQEGWHIEEDENGNWSYNGVVFNEMRGVFSSVDNVMMYKLLEKLFPDTCYGFESGGAPSDIPKLSYEQFVETHKKFYHPSNATIFLDGQVDLERILPLLDSYLCAYDKKECNFNVELRQPIMQKIEYIPYEVSEGDDAIGKVEVAKGYVYGDFTETEKNVAISILCSYLCGTNDSPLKKALLEKGLCEDVYFANSDDTKQRAAFLMARGVPEGKEKEIGKVFDEVIKELCENGIPKEHLIADLNSAQFALKELDFGSTPAGLIFAISARETWLHGGDPTTPFRTNRVFASLRKKLETNFFEDILENVFLRSNHKATIVMVPDVTLAEKNAEKTALEMASLKESTSDEEKEILKAENEKLSIFRNTPDSPEISALVPHLEISDISPECKKDNATVSTVDSTKVYFCEMPLNDIEYYTLMFNLNNLSEKELWAVSELSSILPQSKTTMHSALDFSTRVKTWIGKFNRSIAIYSKKGDLDYSKAYLTFNIGILKENEPMLLPILKERLFETVFEVSKVREILKRDKLEYEISLKENGNRHASTRVKACLSQSGRINEILTGETGYKYICEALENVEEFVSLLESLTKRVFVKKRLSIQLIGKPNDAMVSDLISIIPKVDCDLSKIKFDLLTEKDSKIDITSDVSYAAKAINIFNYLPENSGAFSVAMKIVSLEYLWNEVRVKGGAYGCSCGIDERGNMIFASFRDPNPENTLKVYNSAADALRSLAEDCTDLDKYIIGTISSMTPLQSLYTSGKAQINRLISEITHERRNKRRKQVLETTKEDLLKAAEILDNLENDGPTCVVG